MDKLNNTSLDGPCVFMGGNPIDPREPEPRKSQLDSESNPRRSRQKGTTTDKEGDSVAKEVVQELQLEEAEEGSSVQRVGTKRKRRPEQWGRGLGEGVRGNPLSLDKGLPRFGPNEFDIDTSSASDSNFVYLHDIVLQLRRNLGDEKESAKLLDK